MLKDIIGYGNSETEISNLTIDSRKAKEGSLYFAIRGTQVDGHRFIEDAYKNGASVAVVEEKTDCPIEQVVVENTRIAMAHMASRFYSCPAEKLKMIGVTGTNGKTSISFMVREIAKASSIKCGVIGTGGIYAENEKLDIPILTSTTPDPIELQYALSEMVKRNMEWVVMEVTAHALDLHKTDGTVFSSAGFTNLTQDHLDYFLTMENYACAKERFFLPENAQKGIINADDVFGKEILKKNSIPMISYSLNGKGDICAENIVSKGNGTEFDLLYENKKYPVKTHTVGMFNVSNLLCATGCALVSGASIENCIKGMESFTSVPGRFESVNTHGKGCTVIIDYAHTPDGLENVLSAINSFKKGKLICVFGCGGNRDSAKRPIMGEVAGRLSDYCVLTSDNPRFEEPDSIIDGIEQGIKDTNCPYKRVTDREEAVKYAIEYADKGDVIAICGKGDEDYQEIQGVKRHFSDRETVEEIIGGKYNAR